VGQQHVLHARQQLASVEGFAQKVDGAAAQSAQQKVFTRLRGEHHHGGLEFVTQALDLRHHVVAVQVGHVDVEQDQVRPCGLVAR